MSFKNTKYLVIICYGNILRSQVLEQYLRHHAALMNIDINLDSAGIAGKDEFTDQKNLYNEISQELAKRNVLHNLFRNPWDKKVEEVVKRADIVICADKNIKSEVLKRMQNQIDTEKLHTFYEFIEEGETDFEDTYDYEKKRQDPIRFKNAFDELERIAQKTLLNFKKIS